MKEKTTIKFPKGFLWGASTSAYQVEGGIFNDWSEWEKKNKKRLANEAGKYWQDWQKEMFPEMFDPENYICGQGCDSYNNFDGDLRCIKELNLGAYRMGIEWARIEPREGEFNMKEIEHYRKVLKKLKENNIKIVLTLWHWTLPIWVSEQGGVAGKDFAKQIARYSQLVINELGSLVDYWITLNEPLMIIGHGYLTGKFPPNKKKDLIGSIKVFYNYIKAHKLIYKLIHDKLPKAQVSIAMTTGFFEPAHSWNLIEVLMAKVAHYFRNEYFVKKVKNQLDFIGVNYYHHDRLIWRPPFKDNLNETVDDRGWEFFPRGIYEVLIKYKKFKKPILITENGTADAEDKLREKYIKEHLRYIHRAISEGVDVRGYFHWSLLDNFEWAEGWWPKFGLCSVDRKTFERKLKSSAKKYAEICRNNLIK